LTSPQNTSTTRTDTLGYTSRSPGRRAVTDPQCAEHLASAVASTNDREPVLAELAGAIAAVDPAHASRIAEAITDSSRKAAAYANIAREWFDAAK
jgi:hypothetical protein